MKTIDEMTKSEILSLKDEDVDMTIHIECMKQGIKLMNKPKSKIFSNDFKKDTRRYQIGNFGIYFDNLKEAEKVADFLKSCKNIVDNSYVFGYEYMNKKIEHSFEIASYEAYSQEQYEKIKEIKEREDKDKKRI